MSSYHTKGRLTSKRGAFMHGIWHCDCEPRLPADKFQTKNGGKNHGRWFYTCQNPQHKRCGFFLWADEAKLREEGAVLNNSRTEPDHVRPPQTPQKPERSSMLQAATPVSRSKLMSPAQSPSKQPLVSPTRTAAKHTSTTDDFDWSSGNDDELTSAVDAYETPRKTPRTSAITSPSKRNQGRLTDNDDVFTTPPTTKRIGLTSPRPTPAHPPPQPAQGQEAPSESLAEEALLILSPVLLPARTKDDLTDLLNKFELKSHGISKGRDITRLALQQKDQKITELQTRIHALEQERETLKNVISLLKSDMAASPKRNARRQTTSGDGDRSEA